MQDYNKNDFFIYSFISFLIVGFITVLFLFPLSKNSNLKYNSNAVQKQNPKLVQNSFSPYFNAIDIPLNKNLPGFSKYKFVYTYSLFVNDVVKNLEILIPIPVSENEKQYISNVIINPKPLKYLKIKDNIVAKYSFPELSAGEYNIIFSGSAHIRTYNIKNAKKLNTNISPEKDLSKYLLPEKAIESNDSYIKSIANTIIGDTQEEIAENIYKYIQDNILYKNTNYLLSAKEALYNKYGKCGEFSSIMTALLRAKNIPARIVIGNIARENDNQHNWVEVYFDKYGWVTYDPTASPSILKIYSPNGKLLKIEKNYDVSPDNLQYIKSGINSFSPYYMRYVSESKDNAIFIKTDFNIFSDD